MFHESSYIGRILLLLFLFLPILALLFLEYRLINTKGRRLLLLVNTLVFAMVFFLECRLLENHIPALCDKVWNPVPIALPMVFLWSMAVVFSIYALVFLILNHRKEKKTLGRASIKQTLDEIPLGISIFRRDGTLSLCNRKMLELSDTLWGRCFMTLEELRSMLAAQKSLQETEDIYRFPDGSAWRYEEGDLTTEDGMRYRRVSFFDVTEISRLRKDLEEQRGELRQMQMQIYELSKNSRELAKEEEILAIKSAWHDVMGEGLTAIRRLLTGRDNDKEAEEVILRWKKAVASIRRDNDFLSRRRNELEDLYLDAKAVGIQFILKGMLPKNRDILDAFALAIRTCLLNAVQHAKATKLYAELYEKENEYLLLVSNNGLIPKQEVIPSGGLLNVQNYAAYLGGEIRIQWKPCFQLMVILPRKGTEI